MKQIMKYIRKILRILGVLLLGIIIGFIALCLVHLIPVEKMYQNVQASKAVINSFAEIVPGYKSTAVDDFTDSIMINEAICQVEAPLIEKVINNYQVNYWKGYSQQENLLRYLDGETGYQYQGYSHYWGGHQVVLKPLLLFFDYSDILILNYILQTLLVVFIIVGFCRTGREYAVLPFSVAVITLMPIATGVCLQFSTVFYVTMLGCLALIWNQNKRNRIYHEQIVLFLILGMSTSYFDFLTYPFVSLGIPLIVAIMYADNKGWLQQIWTLAKNSVAWCIGYAGMWSGKWILGSILSPDSGSMKVAIGSIKYRGSNLAEGLRLTVFDVTLKNMFVYLRRPTILLILIPAVYFILKIIQKRKWEKSYLLYCIPYILLCAYPIAWYMITKNHSYEHAFMAYRELAIATFSGLTMLAGWGNKKIK